MSGAYAQEYGQAEEIDKALHKVQVGTLTLHLKLYTCHNLCYGVARDWCRGGKMYMWLHPH